MRCQKCRSEASLEIRRHHAAFCATHFLDFFERQVERAVETGKMFTREDRVLVVVLCRLGYQTTGLYINLGIGQYSEESQQKAAAYARSLGAPLLIADIPG